VERKYYPNVFYLPPALDFTLPDKCEPTITTDDNEQFALFAFHSSFGNIDCEEIILMFTEDEGFVRINNLEVGQCLQVTHGQDLRIGNICCGQPCKHKRVIIRVKC